jgi:hypothetical protein
MGVCNGDRVNIEGAWPAALLLWVPKSCNLEGF